MRPSIPQSRSRGRSTLAGRQQGRSGGQGLACPCRIQCRFGTCTCLEVTTSSVHSPQLAAILEVSHRGVHIQHHATLQMSSPTLLRLGQRHTLFCCRFGHLPTGLPAAPTFVDTKERRVKGTVRLVNVCVCLKETTKYRHYSVEGAVLKRL